MLIKIKNYLVEFLPTSDESKKKYKVVIYNEEGYKIKTLQFGDKAYEQYEDITPLKLYSDMDHKDSERRYQYRQRHSKIYIKNGMPAYKDPLQPAFYSWNFLW
jgi:hypothetical protein